MYFYCKYLPEKFHQPARHIATGSTTAGTSLERVMFPFLLFHYSQYLCLINETDLFSICNTERVYHLLYSTHYYITPVLRYFSQLAINNISPAQKQPAARSATTAHYIFGV
jgi:hypothetical protein